ASAPPRREPRRLDDPTQPHPSRQPTVDPLLETGRQRARPPARPSETVPHEDRLARLALREARHDRGDLGDLTPHAVLAPHHVVAVDVHDEVERLDEDP